MSHRERSPIYQTRATRVLQFSDLRRPRRRGRLVAALAGLLALVAVAALIGQGLRVAAQPGEAPAGSRPDAPRERVIEELAEAAAAGPAPTAAPGPAALTVAGTAGFGLRLRPEPGLAGAPIAILPEGSATEPTGKRADADGLAWLEVRAAGGMLGWAAAEYLE